MAVTISPGFSNFSTIEVEDTALAASAVQNIASGPCWLASLNVVNAAGVAVHLKLYDNVSPTVGGTSPDVIVIFASGENRSLLFECTDSTGARLKGLPFTNGLSMACVQEAGTAGTTAPGGSGVSITGVLFQQEPE